MTTTRMSGGSAVIGSALEVVAAVLAVTALINVAPARTVAVATMVAAAGLVMRARERPECAQQPSPAASRVALAASRTARVRAQTLVGSGAMTLGALGLFDVNPPALVSVSVIALGGALMIGVETAPIVEVAVTDASLDVRRIVIARPYAELLIGMEAATLGFFALAGGTLLNSDQQQMVAASGLIVVVAGLIAARTGGPSGADGCGWLSRSEPRSDRSSTAGRLC